MGGKIKQSMLSLSLMDPRQLMQLWMQSHSPPSLSSPKFQRSCCSTNPFNSSLQANPKNLQPILTTHFAITCSSTTAKSSSRLHHIFDIIFLMNFMLVQQAAMPDWPKFYLAYKSVLLDRHPQRHLAMCDKLPGLPANEVCNLFVGGTPPTPTSVGPHMGRYRPGLHH